LFVKISNGERGKSRKQEEEGREIKVPRQISSLFIDRRQGVVKREGGQYAFTTSLFESGNGN